MGGGSYDRDVYGSSSSSNWGSSTTSSAKMSSSNLDYALMPNKVLTSKSKHPIIIVLDVTGSNINFARLLYDKLPMLYGQIEQKKYVDDFELSICAVGDAYCDTYPLQIGDFAKGIALDAIIEKLVLEGGGGGQQRETYELAAYYMLNNTKFVKGATPMLFFIGDESYYTNVSAAITKNFKMPTYATTDENASDVFNALKKKFNNNVFMFLNKYGGDNWYDGIIHDWKKVMPPEHVIKINEEKSIVDLMLGVISMLSSSRDLDNYVVDMIDRGQTKTRVANVKKSLKGLVDTMLPTVTINTDIAKSNKKKTTEKRGSRL